MKNMNSKVAPDILCPQHADDSSRNFNGSQDEVSSDEEDQIIEGIKFEHDASNGLSYEKMMHHYNYNHPLIHEESVGSDNKQKTTFKKYPICGTKTGRFSCRAKARKSDLEQYGTGIVVFFQLQKTLFLIFLLCFLFAAPSTFYFYAANPIVNWRAITDAQDFVKRFTLGNIGAMQRACFRAEGAKTDDFYTKTFDLQCNEGRMTGITFYGQRESFSEPFCDDLSTRETKESDFKFYPKKCNYNHFSNETRVELDTAFNSQCTNSTSCTFKLGPELVNYKKEVLEKCLGFFPNYDHTMHEWALVAECKSDEHFQDILHQKLMVGCDLLMCLLVWIIVQLMDPCLKVIDHEVSDDIITGPDFTVQIKCPQTNKSVHALTGLYYDWAQNILKNAPKIKVKGQETQPEKYEDEIANVHIAVNSYNYLDIVNSVASKFENRHDLKIQHKNSTNVKQKESLKKQIVALENQILSLMAQKEQIIKKVHEKSIFVFIQFRSMTGKQKFEIAVREKSSTQSFCDGVLQHCFTERKIKVAQQKFLNQKPMILDEAINPSLILWENLSVSRKSRRWRSCGIFFQSCLIMIITFSCLILVNHIDSILLAKIPWTEDDCDNMSAVTQEEADYAQHLGKTTAVFCYCDQQLYRAVDILTLKIGDDYPCVEWSLHLGYRKTLVKVLSYVVGFINLFLNNCVQSMAKHQRKYTIPEKLVSIIENLWFIQFINSAILATFMKTKVVTLEGKLPSWFPFFNGQYEQYSAGWYNNVGIVIAGSCFVNSILIAYKINAIFWAYFYQCKDRGWTRDPKKTKKILQKDYEALYQGGKFSPEIVYSMQINMIYTIFIYGTTMPILYVCGMILAVTTYWSQKIFFLRYYRIPPKYKLFMIKKVQTSLRYAIVFHMFVSVSSFQAPQIQKEYFDLLKVEGTWLWIFCQPTLLFWNLSVNIFRTKTVALVTWPLVLYVNGFVFGVLLDIFESWFGCIKKSVDHEKCCLRRSMSKNVEHSQDMYEDLQPDLLQKEYKHTIDMEREYSLAVQRGHQLDFIDFKSIQQFHEFLQYKRKELKKVTAKASSKEAQNDDSKAPQIMMGETNEVFNKIIKEVNFNKSRINSNHSYSIHLNENFIKSKFAEEKFSKLKNKLGNIELVDRTLEQSAHLNTQRSQTLDYEPQAEERLETLE